MSEVVKFVRGIGTAFADTAGTIEANGIDGQFLSDLLDRNDVDLTNSIAKGGLGFSRLQVNCLRSKIEKLGCTGSGMGMPDMGGMGGGMGGAPPPSGGGGGGPHIEEVD